MFYSINKHSERFRLNATEFGGMRETVCLKTMRSQFSGIARQQRKDILMQ